MSTEVEGVPLEEAFVKTEEVEPVKSEENHVEAEEETKPENEVQTEVKSSEDEVKEDGDAAEGNGSVPPAEEKVKFCCPTPSHELPNPVLSSLMLETFLKMAKIPHERVHQKKVKHVYEYKGDKVSSVESAIESLSKTFEVDLDSWMTPLEKAYARCIFTTILESTFWSLDYYRWVDNYKNTKKTYANNLPPVMNMLSPKLFQNKVKKQVEAHGLCDNVYERAEEDLKAFSTILGDKEFMMGSEPATVDAALFSLLATVMFSCPESKQAELLKQAEYKNLADYVSTMKEHYWLDWDEACGNESEMPKKKRFSFRLSGRKARTKSTDQKESPTDEQPPSSPEKENGEENPEAAAETEDKEEGAKTEEEDKPEEAAESEEKKEDDDATEEKKDETTVEEQKEATE